MSGWVRVDTAFPHHLKLLTVGPLGAWIYLRGLCYAGEARSDGFIPAAILPELLAGLEPYSVVIDARSRGRIRRTQPATQIDWPTRLVAARLWEPVEGGWMIHNYLKRNPTKVYMDALSEVRSEVGKRGAKARWGHGKPDGNLPMAKWQTPWQTDSKPDGTIRNETEKLCFVSPEGAPDNGHSAPHRGDYLTALERIHAKLAAQRPEAP